MRTSTRRAAGATLATIVATMAIAAAFSPFAAWANEHPASSTDPRNEDLPLYELVYQGSNDGFAPFEEDLFAHFGSLQPGEQRMGRIAIENAGSTPCDFYLHANQNVEANRQEAEDALSHIRLTVASTKDGNVLYEGDLKAKDMAGGVYLGTLEKGERIEFDFAVDVPSHLGNEFALINATVPWVFAAQEVPYGGSTPPAGDDDISETPLLAKTGSLPAIALIGALGAVAIAAAIAAFAAKAHTFAESKKPSPRRRRRSARKEHALRTFLKR